MKNNNVPAIRFKGFTDAWEQRKLGDEFKKVNERNDGSFGKEHWISVAKMFYQLEDKVQSNNIDTRTYVMRWGDIAFEGHPNKDFKFGRFVVNDIGDGVVSELFPIYRHVRDYNNYYWKYAIQIERIMVPVYARSITSSGNSSNKLDQKHFLRQSILIPNLEEQGAIGSLFATLDNLITLHQRKLDKLQDLKKALLQKLFPKNGLEYPEVRFRGFTHPWEQRKLGNLAEFSKGNGFSKMDLVENGTPILLYGRLYTNYETVIKNIDTFAVFDDKAVLSCGGEVVVPASGESAEEISRASVISIPGVIIGGDLNVIKPYYGLESDFLALTISNGSQQKELSRKAQGKSVVHLRNSDLKEINILFPIPAEQKKISNIVDALDNLITLHQRELELLQETKKAFLQKLFV